MPMRRFLSSILWVRPINELQPHRGFWQTMTIHAVQFNPKRFQYHQNVLPFKTQLWNGIKFFTHAKIDITPCSATATVRGGLPI